MKGHRRRLYGIKDRMFYNDDNLQNSSLKGLHNRAGKVNILYKHPMHGNDAFTSYFSLISPFRFAYSAL